MSRDTRPVLNPYVVLDVETKENGEIVRLTSSQLGKRMHHPKIGYGLFRLSDQVSDMRTTVAVELISPSLLACLQEIPFYSIAIDFPHPECDVCRNLEEGPDGVLVAVDPATGAKR